ncbi:MAG TPA: GNAT family N-acetyltransferase [Solirubrobacterales bacterium]|nr:GNAT family N-acetyltransferase [Solirubrobacterales bacterium]
MSVAVEVSAVREGEFEALLPLIAAYQRFYEVVEIDDDRNRSFFRRFLSPSLDGALLAARDDDGAILGYACLYWHFSSLQAVETVLMNDLFVTPEARGRGVGRALIEAAADVARERGAAWLEWSTAPDNRTAQRLYDSLTSEKSTWLSYELPV